jgi:hypothetical protein
MEHGNDFYPRHAMKMNRYILLGLLLLMGVASSFSQDAQQAGRYTSIVPGAVWLDTDGHPIQAHGFSLFYKDGTYYWYGENKEYTTQGSNVWTYGVRCYKSRDFYNWQDCGLIIKPDTVNVLSPLHYSQSNDRPHIIYCGKTKQYVAWIKNLGEHGFFTILTADKFEGPYRIVRTGYKPDGYEVGDFDLYVDEKTDKAYVWFERPHWEMICAQLTSDYTGVTKRYSEHFVGRIPPFARESPAHFVRGKHHYLFTSGTSGYEPNPSLITTFDAYHGKYTDLGNPCPDDKTNTTYCSQITDVIKIPGKQDLYVALADRWKPASCGTDTPYKEWQVITKRFIGHRPAPRSYSIEKVKDLSGVKRDGWDVTCNATYVWLPITWKNGVPVIYWKDEWRLEDYK